MLIRLLTILLCLMLIVPAMGQSDDKPYEGTSLNFIYIKGAYTNGLEELAPKFEEMTGINVEFELLSEEDSVRKVQLELASGAGNYDVVGIQSGNVPLYAENGWVTPVESFWGTDASDPEQLSLDDIIGSTLGALAYGGVQQCLPHFAATTIMYYQLDIFAAAGIESPPTTYDELLEMAPLLHTDEVPLIALRGNPPAAHGNIWHYNSFFHGEGAQYFADFPNDLTPMVNSEAAIRALENFVALKSNYGPEGVAAYQYPDVVTAMQQGNVVMVVEGAPLAGIILDPEQSKVSGNLGFAVMPGGAAGPKPGFAAHGMCVTADSAHQEAAYMFLEWAMSFETMKEIALILPHIAVTRDQLWEDEDFNAKYDYDFGGGSFLKAYQNSLAHAPPDYYPAFAAWPLIGDIMGQAVQEAEIGAKSPTDALNEANELITQMLQDEGYLD